MSLRVSAQSTLANVSPSVALEKGAYYRTRASHTRPPPVLNPITPYPHYRTPPRNQQNTKLVTLLLLLALACIACFGTAYYLFKTRWETPADHPLRTLPANPPSFQVNASICDDNFGGRGSHLDPEERFLAYLPHSGFHNQRIAFENALTLARLLNRTLIVPPIRLGNKPIPYYPLDRLSRTLAFADKTGLNHCVHIYPGLSTPFECLDYFDYTHIPWDWLVNLTLVNSRQKLVCRWNFTEKWFHDALGIVDNQILLIRDLTPYHYRFVSNGASSSEKNWYTEDISIDFLARQEQRLLLFGTLFGSTRLQLQQQQHLDIRREIREAMTITHPILDRVSNSISKALGDAYLAIHLRASEHKFEGVSEPNARAIWWILLHRFLNVTTDDVMRLEQPFQGTGAQPSQTGPRSAPVPTHLDSSSHAPLNNTERSALELASRSMCRLPRMRTPALGLLGHSPPLLYIATDLKNTQHHPLLLRFRTLFPCTFDLSDFVSHLAPLDQLVNPTDGVPLRPHFLPFVDALVAAKALRVVGTKGSTFSHYIEDVLWKRSHNLPIKQRG